MTEKYSYSVITIAALDDNFIYLCQYDQDCALAVDPCNASAVLEILRKNALTLTTILVTHHHWDHIAEVEELKRRTGCIVIGADKRRISSIDRVVDDEQILTLGNAKVQVVATPGHTRTSVCYYIQLSNNNKKGVVFTGDTLFVNGCGRILECEASTMLDSLLKLASLPDDTLVYCGHDYTVENYKFALTIEPDNEAIQKRLEEVRQAVSKGSQTVPSTIFQEKATNPFLRADTVAIKAALNMQGAQAVEVFAELRRRKDIFG